MKTMTCDLCSTSEFKLLFCINNFDIGQCLKCGLVFVGFDYKKVDLATIYDTYRSDSQLEKQEKHGAQIANDFIIESKKLGFKHFERLLDVGCGLGFFLKVAKNFVKECLGTEISDSQVSFATEKLGVKVLKGRLTELRLPRESFDVITMWDVIEHLPSPTADLTECHRLLKKGGIVVISTPNFNSFTRRIVGKNWLALNPPEHISYFNPKTLEANLRKTGFLPLRIFTRGLSFFNLLQSSRIKTNNREKVWQSQAMKCNRPQNYKVPLKLLNRIIIDRVLGLFSMGEHITTYAMKAPSKNHMGYCS